MIFSQFLDYCFNNLLAINCQIVKKIFRAKNDVFKLYIYSNQRKKQLKKTLELFIFCQKWQRKAVNPNI